MAAKKKSRRPTRKELEKDEIASVLKHFEEKFPNEFRQFAEWAMNPEKRIEAERRDEANKRIEDFLSNLQSIPAGYELPKDFEMNWEALLAAHEEEQKDQLVANGSNPTQLASWIKRGWITADKESLALKSHLKKPIPDLHPIPMVLINHGGRWLAPTMMDRIVRVHPFVRAVTETLPELSVEQQIRRAMRRFQELREEGSDRVGVQAEAADTLEAFLYEPTFGDPKEFGWLAAAKESDHFWLILNAAIGFGRTLANDEVYGDGSMQMQIQRWLVLSGGRRKSEVGSKIEQLISEYLGCGNNKVTPKKLLSWLGGKPSEVTDDDDIDFPRGSRGIDLKGISWNGFKNLVKSASRRMENGF